MGKLWAVLYIYFFCIPLIHGQRMVVGRIIGHQQQPLIGASVVVKGTNLGTATDLFGSFEIMISPGFSTLVVSYTGYATKEVEATSDSLVISLEEGLHLEEAIITAFGIQRTKNSIGYAVQEIQGVSLTQTGDLNFISSLTGKIAGIQIISASGASVGGTAKIRIRGASGLFGSNPLFVVDGTPISNDNFSGNYSGIDFGNLASDILPEEIESITILKGPTATAIYGNRGAHGVVLITTKKGESKKGVGITFHSGMTYDQVYLLPPYQNEFGGGYDGNFLTTTDPKDGKSYKILNYSADESWGPRMDGTMYRPWWSWFEGADYGKEISLSPNPSNVKDFFQSGITLNHGISFSGGSESTVFRFSFHDVRQSGVVPNAYLKRNHLSLQTSSQLTEKWKLGAHIHFVLTEGRGRPTFGYAANNPVSSFNQWFQRQLAMEPLKNYRHTDGNLKSWNLRSNQDLRPLYWDNPFFVVYENFPTDRRDRYFGNISVQYQILDGLLLTGFLRRDSYTQHIETRTATGGVLQDAFSERKHYGVEANYEFILQYQKNFGRMTLDASFGGNNRHDYASSTSVATVGGLNAANLFNIKASVDRPEVSNYSSQKMVRSLYGGATLGYKSLAYLAVTLRNDWSSTLPLDQNAYLYPSLTSSFIFSEKVTGKWLSFGKWRMSVAQVGTDIGPYQTQFTYRAGVPFGNYPAFTLPNISINESIRPTRSTSLESGIELKFLQQRMGLDLTGYRTDARDQILTIPVSGASGFSSGIINAGHIRSEGIEWIVYADIIDKKNWHWEVRLNGATNRSSVHKLSDGITNQLLDSWGWGGLSIHAPVGGKWGTIKGRGYQVYECGGCPGEGQKVMTPEGRYIVQEDKDLGSILPNITGGLRSILSYKGFSVDGLIEFQSGGRFHSTTKMFSAFSGISKETVGINDRGKSIREPVTEGGGIKLEGVLEDGTPHVVYVDAQSYYRDQLFALNEHWIYDASYMKWRELSLGFDLPARLLEKVPFQVFSISLMARNIWLIYARASGIDPSEISPGSNDFVFQENGILPGVRSIGFKMKVGF
jgi:TonB-linked SusC/RagA family outer membrane protein